MNRDNVITIAKNEKYLRQISSVVKENDNAIKNDINILEEFCKENKVLAMAAIQLGIPKRIIYLKNTNLELVNKQIADTATSEEEGYNDCNIGFAK